MKNFSIKNREVFNLLNQSDLLDAGMVVQKARKQGTVWLQWGFIGFYNKQSYFPNKEAYFTKCRTVG